MSREWERLWNLLRESSMGLVHSAILIIIERQLQDFQRFSSSKLVLKTIESRFAALNYYENGSCGCCCCVR